MPGSPAPPTQSSAAFLAGGGELGELSRSRDWISSSLGHPADWPQSLKTVVRVMLTSRQPIWVGWGRELTFFYNDPYKAIIGGKHPQALGQPTSQVWSEIWTDIGPMLDKAMGGVEGTYVEEQLLIMERNGYREETYYTFSYSPIPDDDGNPGGIICANSDDTKRVIGERQLNALRDLAATLGNSRAWKDVCRNAAAALAKNARDIPFALIYMADDDGVLSLAGAAGIVDGHTAAPPTIAATADQPWPMRAALAGGDVHVVDGLTTTFKDPLPLGAWSEAPSKAAVLHITSAGETGRSGVLIVGLNPFRLFDETYRDFLALAAGQIGAAIANVDAYEHERQRAEALAELDRAKTAFFSNLSHEFRTPLTLMLGPLEESLDNAASLPASELGRVKTVHRNSLRLLKLVNALLDFSRIEAGRMQASFEPTGLSEFTADLASNFRSATERAGLQLDIDCPPLAAPVYVDRDMWEKIVLNLLSNAFKFTFDGSIRVALRTHGGSAELIVQDTGTGVPASELPRLFERFHRVQGARGRSFEGSGIGLALVKELVEQHGGTIHVASDVDHGTTFTIDIPLGHAHLAKEQLRAAQTPAAATAKAQAFVEEAIRWLPGQSAAPRIDDAADLDALVSRPLPSERARVLVADDNADMRDYIGRLLGARHDCEMAADGEAALAATRRRRPDLLLTDIMMPKLDGFGLIKAIRSDDQLRDLPIIVLSARAGEEASVEGLSAGADDYLVKPFSAREMIARVDGALAMARVRRTMSEAVREEANALEILNRIGSAVAAELDLERAVQTVTDAATELTGAQFGAFFYNITNDKGESYMLYSLAGVAREAVDKFPMPRNTDMFAPNFAGDGIVRSDDILKDPRYGKNAPHFGVPIDHLTVRSYLAAPVVSRSGEVLGGLFFGHAEPSVFTARAERLLAGIAAHAAIAIDNARLYQAAQTEIATRKRTEAALRRSEEEQLRLNQSLEIKVAERTAEIAAANEQLIRESEERAKVELALRQSQKMDAVGKLTGGVAHDFNNLLQVVGGNLQLLIKDVAGSEKAEQRVRNALAGVSRGSKLASQLLAFGRRQPLAPKVVNLGRFVRGLDDLLRRALGDGVEVETVISGGLWNSLVDPSQVENAILNLAINARDAMSGHGKLTIEAGNAALTDDYAANHLDVSAGQYVMLAVTDTGHGMTPEVIEHAFEPFFTTKSEGRGTGLGLSMVYGFVKQSNGHINIYSEPGHGTTVRIYLPRVLQTEDIAVEVDAGVIVGGSELVLAVEDDQDVRDTVVELLADLGYRVLKAKDAQDALAIIESGAPIDVLFTDVVMPGPIRSPELARQARERLPNVAILFTSGYTDNAIVHGGRLDPGIELLSKPYSREALARKLRHVLRDRDPAPTRTLKMADTNALTILFVEDDELVRLSMAELMTELGHTVLQAASGADAMRLLAAADIDILMTDDNLPDMRGGDVAATAREKSPDLPVIFATGSSAMPTASNGAKIGNATLLRKPFNLKALNDALQSAAKNLPST